MPRPRYSLTKNDANSSGLLVIPAQAGIQGLGLVVAPWAPAFAGVTKARFSRHGW